MTACKEEMFSLEMMCWYEGVTKGLVDENRRGI